MCRYIKYYFVCDCILSVMFLQQIYFWLHFHAMKIFKLEYFTITIAIIKTTKKYGLHMWCMCTSALYECARVRCEAESKTRRAVELISRRKHVRTRMRQLKRECVWGVYVYKYSWVRVRLCFYQESHNIKNSVCFRYSILW